MSSTLDKSLIEAIGGINHTAEPWRTEADTKSSDFFWISSDTEPEIAMIPDGRIGDAKRIVACVNACAGIDTDRLTDGIVLKNAQRVARERWDFKTQQDELLAALEGVLPFLTGNYWPGVEADAAVDRAVAIARKLGAGSDRKN